jgi:hypothetical protein
MKFKNNVLDNLVSKWCEKKELRPLSLILPAYTSNLGTEDGLNKLVSALSYLSATRCLDEEEQILIDGLVVGLSDKR